MESNLPPPSSTRKVKYAPKAPRRPPANPPLLLTKSEDAESGDAEINEALLRIANDHLTRKRPQAEKKSSVQVAFTHEAASSPSLRTFGKPAEDARVRDDRVGSVGCTSGSKQELASVAFSGVESSDNSIPFPNQPKRRDYREPWDYHNSCYPVTLPLRRPYSGDPELLDEEEFGENASLEYDENATSSASELGLLDECDEKRMIFFQLPGNIFEGLQTNRDGRVASILQRRPMVGYGPGTGIHRKLDESSASSVGNGKLEGFPPGFLGKMLVYKSGAVKLKLGDILYDVSPGCSGIFAQDIVAINAAEKHCCAVGEISNKAVVSPDVDFLLDK